MDFSIKQDANKQSIYVEPGYIYFKNTYISSSDQFKFVYVFGPIDKNELTYKTISKEEFDAFNFKKSSKTLYG